MRQRWVENNERLAERFHTPLLTVDGDEWVPTYRPDRLAEIILAAVERAEVGG